MKFLFRGQPHDPHTPIPTILFGPLSDHGSCNKKNNKNFLCHSNLPFLFFPLFPSLDYQFIISSTISLEIKNKYFDRRKLWKLKFKENASLWRSGSDGSALDIVGNIQAGSESRAERGRFPWAAEQRGGGRLNFQIGRASRYECTLPRVYFQYARAIKVYGREANNCQAFRVVRLAGWKNRVGLKYGRPCSKGSRHRDLRAQRWCTARIYRAASHVTAARDTHVQNL